MICGPTCWKSKRHCLIIWWLKPVSIYLSLGTTENTIIHRFDFFSTQPCLVKCPWRKSITKSKTNTFFKQVVALFLPASVAALVLEVGFLLAWCDINWQLVDFYLVFNKGSHSAGCWINNPSVKGLEFHCSQQSSWSVSTSDDGELHGKRQNHPFRRQKSHSLLNHLEDMLIWSSDKILPWNLTW